MLQFRNHNSLQSCHTGLAYNYRFLTLSDLSSSFQARFKHELFIALLIKNNLYAVNFLSNKWKQFKTSSSTF
jgi:hypothetical protein